MKIKKEEIVLTCEEFAIIQEAQHIFAEIAENSDGQSGMYADDAANAITNFFNIEENKIEDFPVDEIIVKFTLYQK